MYCNYRRNIVHLINMVCFRYIVVNTAHKGDDDDDDDDDDDNINTTETHSM